MNWPRPIRVASNPGIFAGAIITALLVFAGYLVQPGYHVVLGSPTDGPLIDGFSGAEHTPKDAGLGYDTYRWLGSYGSITLADAGGGPFRATLTVNGSRPPGQTPPTLRVSAAGHLLLDVRPTPGVGSYSFDVPRSVIERENGKLKLEMAANSFHVPGDARDLGIIVAQLDVQQAGSVPAGVPPAHLLVPIVASSILVGLLLAALGWGMGAVAAGAVLPGLLAAGLLASDRLWLTTGGWYNRWPDALLLAAVVVALLAYLGNLAMRAGGVNWTALERRAVLTITAAAFVVRLAGQLNPQVFVYDLGFHVNILHMVERGNLLFTTQPAEFGGFGHSTFYLPTPYLFVAPIHALLGDERNAVRVLTVLMGSIGTLPVFYIARRLLHSGRAGILAALLYVSLPMSVLPYSWGITANIFGECFALLSLAVALASGPTLHPRRPAFWVLTALLSVTLLSHPGVVALAGVAFGLFFLLGLGMGGAPLSRKAWPLASLALAGVFAVAIYYNHFLGQMLESARQIGAEHTTSPGGETGFTRVVGGSVEDNTLGLVRREVHTQREWVLGLFSGVWREAVAYYRAWPFVGTPLGLLLVWPGRVRTASTGRAESSRWVVAASVWLLVVALFAVVGWLTNAYVRYMLFALPVLAIGAGTLISGIWARGAAARLLCGLLLVFFVVEALDLWHYRITYLFK